MILVCAATRTEAGACRRGVADAKVPGIEVLTTGVGPERAAGALRRRLGSTGASSPALVVSSGFAGALTGGVPPLAWITALSVHRLLAGRPVEVALAPGLLQLARGALPCHVLSAPHAVAEAIAGLAAPAAVDMESAALAEVAARAGVPFAVLRLVTDTPERPLATLGRRLAAALAADGATATALAGARAALDAARSPASAAAFLRESLGWRARLREGWRDHARRL